MLGSWVDVLLALLMAFWTFDPIARTIDLTWTIPNSGAEAMRLYGLPIKVWTGATYGPGTICVLQCADDSGPTFHVSPGVYPIQKFMHALTEYQKRYRMNNPDPDYVQPYPPELHNTWINRAVAEIESEFTDEGPLSFAESDSIGVPLQEQVEQVEDALGKALNVIEAFVALEKDLRSQVYQAQLDAQDWQNKYNSLNAYENDTRAIGKVVRARDEREISSLRGRIDELTEQNTHLELRNEQQAKTISLGQLRARAVVSTLEGN